MRARSALRRARARGASRLAHCTDAPRPSPMVLRSTFLGYLLHAVACYAAASTSTGTLTAGLVHVNEHVGAPEGTPSVSSGPSTLWANVRQLQPIIVRGSFTPGTNISCRVVDAPCVSNPLLFIPRSICACGGKTARILAAALCLVLTGSTTCTGWVQLHACNADDGTNFCPYCQSPAGIPRPGHVINSTAASCVVAGSASGIYDPTKDAGHGGSPGYAAGSGQLMFSTDNHTWPHKGWPLDFVPLIDAAIGRRPYFTNETQAELIVSIGTPLATNIAIKICASALGRAVFPCTTVYSAVDGRSVAMPFNLTALPPTFNTTISVDFSCATLGFSGSLERW